MTSDIDHPSEAPLPPTDEPTLEIDHITVENDDDPNECALFPATASEAELTTTWISAQEGSYIDLESIR